MDHAEVVPQSDLKKLPSDAFYLPMHGVEKEASTTTKLRIVFDASAKTTSGYSLNDQLLTGPNLYPLLTNVLMKFRLHRIGMSADISKMFREVSLRQADRDWHCYLVRKKDGQIQDCRMKRVTFGVRSSPFLATQVLRQLAMDYRDEFSKAADIILNTFYVDDVLTGADTLPEAIHLRTNLNELLAKACMTLRKWRSSSKELMDTVPANVQESQPTQCITSPHDCYKALGIHWDTTKDTFHVATPKLEDSAAPTKRQVLSDVAKTFDVLGFYSPVTVTLKVLLQKLWQLNLGWDDNIPIKLSGIWSTRRKELPLITSHPVLRFYHSPDRQVHDLQIHGFCDASQQAIAGVVDIRSLYTDTTVSTSLVIAKTKVAPLKTVTIPKLELSSAVLLSKLLSTVHKELGIKPCKMFAWCDSTVALGWISTSPHKLKTFVANCVVSITEKVPATQWRHVSSADNPADIGSRGCTFKNLVGSVLWWNGPFWLLLSPDQWPAFHSQNLQNLPELKSTAFVSQPSPDLDPEYFSKYSSFFKLIDVLSWIRRFISNYRFSSELQPISHCDRNR